MKTVALEQEIPNPTIHPLAADYLGLQSNDEVVDQKTAVYLTNLTGLLMNPRATLRCALGSKDWGMGQTVLAMVSPVKWPSCVGPLFLP